MQFIKHSEIKPGDTILYAYDMGALIYYEVIEVKISTDTGTIISGRSFSTYGERWTNKTFKRDTDLVPHTRPVFLISRKGGLQ